VLLSGNLGCIETANAIDALIKVLLNDSFMLAPRLTYTL